MQIFQDEVQQGATLSVGEQVEGGEFDVNDGTVLYIDPNDPQAAALLQQAGLTITEDGTVIGAGIDDSQQGQVVEGAVEGQLEPQVITPETAENQLGSMMEGTDHSSVGVPQELFMSAEDMDSKENLTLEAAVSAGTVIASEPHQVAMDQLTLVQQEAPQLSTETATTPAVTGTRMTTGQMSPKKVVVSASSIKEATTTPKSRSR